MDKLVIVALLLCAPVFAQYNPPSGGGSGSGITGVTAGSGLSGGGTSGTVTITGTVPCVGTPGNTTANYLQSCQTASGAPYQCNNAAGCTVTADWVASAGGATTPNTTGPICGNGAINSTVACTNTGSGSNVLATSPTLVTPNLGTPSAVVLTNATGFASTQLSDTAALAYIASAQTISGAKTFSAQTVDSYSSTASTPSLFFTGTWFTGGTGTTTKPHTLIECNSGTTTSVSTWSTAGTGLGINACSGFTGNFIDLHTNGGGSQTSISTTSIVTTGGIVASGSQSGNRFIATGAAPTVTVTGTSCTTPTSITGNASAGYFTASATGAACVYTITAPVALPTEFRCAVLVDTASNVATYQNASHSTTAAVFNALAVTSGDIVRWSCPVGG